MTCIRQAWLDLDGQTLQLEDASAGYVCQQLDIGYPAGRDVTVNNPDRDGVTDRTQYMGSRVVSANITALVGAGAQIDDVPTLFAPYMLPSVRPVLHYVLDRPGTPERTLTLRGSGFSWPIVGNVQRDLQLQWVAADPIARDPNVQSVTVTTSAPATIASGGDVPVRPLLTINGPITGATVTLTPTLPPVWIMAFLSSFTIPAGHYVAIDTSALTVFYDGDPAKPRLSSIDWTQSSWQWVPPLPSSTNMGLSGTATSGTTNVVATWQDGYLT